MRTAPGVLPSRSAISACGSPAIRVAAASHDRPVTVERWQVAALRSGATTPRALGPMDDVVRCAVFTPRPDGLICSSLAGSIWIWDLATSSGRQIARLERDVVCLAVSPDGQTIACGFIGSAVHLLRPYGSQRYALPTPAEPGRIDTWCSPPLAGDSWSARDPAGSRNGRWRRSSWSTSSTSAWRAR